MQTRKPLLLSAAAVAIAALFAATEIRAQLGPVPLPPPRICTATAGSTATATIVAGPDQNGNPNAQFPRLVNCPADCSGAVVFNTNIPLVGQFFRWDFRWTQIGKSAPSQFGLQVASDVAVEGTSPAISGFSAPGQEESSLKLGANDWDSRWLRFSNISSSSSLEAAYFTKPTLGVRPEGVAARSGTSTGTCQLAGAGTQLIETGQPVSNDVVSTVGQCVVQRILDIRRRTTQIVVLEGTGCVVTTENLQIGTGTAVYISPEAEISVPGSKKSCWSSVDPFTGQATLICVTDPAG